MLRLLLSVRVLPVVFFAAFGSTQALAEDARRILLEVEHGGAILGASRVRIGVDGEPVIVEAGGYRLTIRVDPTRVESARRRYFARVELRWPPEFGDSIVLAPVTILEPGVRVRLTPPTWAPARPVASLTIE